MNYERRWVIQFVHDFPLFIIFYFSQRVWIGVEGRRERVIGLSEISKPYIYIYIYIYIYMCVCVCMYMYMYMYTKNLYKIGKSQPKIVPETSMVLCKLLNSKFPPYQ